MGWGGGQVVVVVLGIIFLDAGIYIKSRLTCSTHMAAVPLYPTLLRVKSDVCHASAILRLVVWSETTRHKKKETQKICV